MSRRSTALLTVVVIAACSVSRDQEVAIGQQSAEEINAQLPLVNDRVITEYITTLGDSIARLTSRGDLDWHFYVVNSRQVNAFAIPGGFIYVNRGLIERAGKMDELAGALGHEIGHVVRRHSVKQMQQAQKANIGLALACTLTNICSHAASQIVIDAGASAWFARHSRKDEAQADSEGVLNVVRAGIDPHGIPDLFRVLLAERRTRPAAVEAFFASHPLEESRIVAAEREIASLDPAELRRLVVSTPQYDVFRRRLMALPVPRDSAIGARGSGLGARGSEVP